MQSVGDSSFVSSLGGIVPALRYRDVRAAAAWLCTAFGFEEHRLIEDEDGSVRYAQLACGSSMIMLCPIGGSAFDAYMAEISETGGRETQVCYVFVPDALAHKARALEAGAELVLDIDAGEGRGQGYSCRDLEGHVWSFGTYDPWRLAPSREGSAPAASPSRLRTLVKFAAVVVASVLASAGLFNWMYASDPGYSAALANIETVLEKPADLESAERLLRQVRVELARERSVRMQAERQGQDLKDASARERATLDKTEHALREELQRERDERRVAETALRQAQGQAQGQVQARSNAPAVVASVKTEAKAVEPAAAAVRPVCEAGAVAPVRTASAVPDASEELAALRRAKEQAEAQLQREKQAREAGSTDAREARDQLERERSAREAAEKQANEARARVARIETLRRAELEKRNNFGYRDLSRDVFRNPGAN